MLVYFAGPKADRRIMTTNLTLCNTPYSTFYYTFNNSNIKSTRAILFFSKTESHAGCIHTLFALFIYIYNIHTMANNTYMPTTVFQTVINFFTKRINACIYYV